MHARVAVAGAHDAIGQVLGVAIWPHVHQFRREVGVRRTGGSIECTRERTSDFQRRGQRLTGIDQHVLALFHRALVLHSHGNDQRVAAAGGNRIVGIVDKAVGWLFAWSRGAQTAIPAQAVGLTLAMQVVGGIAGAREGPGLLRHARRFRPSQRFSPAVLRGYRYRCL